MGRTFGIIIAVECLSDDENSEMNLLNTMLSHSEQGTSVYIAWDSVAVLRLYLSLTIIQYTILRFLAKCGGTFMWYHSN